jgi:putative intracellular protease/amidase
MFDLADTATSQNLILAFNAASKPISFICHGPAPLAHLKVPSTGEFLLKGHHVTGFSTAEIDLMPALVPVPFELEEGLNTASGGGYEKAAEPWGEKVVVSTVNGQTIITGQNPASGKALADAVVKAVLERRSG